MEFEAFEKAVMDAILKDNIEQNPLLLHQYNSAKITSRKFTGHGFFTEFSISKMEYMLPEGGNFELGCLGELEGVQHGVGYVLFVRNGLIVTLEGYTYGEEWPKRIGSFSVSTK